MPTNLDFAINLKQNPPSSLEYDETWDITCGKGGF
jgi:hypothetical protein